jgi:hypothetical protein
METLGPAPDTLTPEKIAASHKPALDQAIAAGNDPQADLERQMLLRQARENILFIKGNHFNVPGVVDSQFGQIVDLVPFDPSGGGAPTGAEVRLCPPVNFIGGDAYTYMAVMGQSAPRVKAVADNPRDPEQIEQAKNADANLRDIWAKQKIDRKWSAVAFHQYATGPVFLRGMWKLDRLKYGASLEPKIELVPGADGIPVPQEVGVQEYENGDAEVEVNSVLEVSILPFTACDLDEVHLLKREVMRSKWDLIAAYPELEQYRDGDPSDREASASSNTAAEAREAAVNPSGTGRTRVANQWRHTEYWLKPFLLEAVNDPQERDLLKRHFPDGLYVAKVGDVVVKCDNRNLKDEWTVVKVGRGGAIMQKPLCSDGVPLQRAINDLTGMALETVLRAITQTLIDSQLIDRDAWATKDAVPAEIIPTAGPVDGDLSKKIAQIPGARLSDQVIPLHQALRVWWETISGISDRLYGGGEPAPTFRQEKMRRDAALAKLSPQAAELRYAAEDIGAILVKLRAKYGAGTIISPSKGAFGVKTDVVDMAQLTETGWHCESNDKFPMSQADTYDTVWGLIKEMPEAAEILGILGPLNIEQVLEVLQVPDFASAMEAQKHKTLDDIQQLLQAQPIEGQPGPNGEPGEKQPSLPMDEFDNHPFVALLISVWMVSEGPRERASNPQGFENVFLFWKLHQQAAQPPQAPPVRGNLNFSIKGEDYPQLLPAAMEAAGISPDQIPAQVQPLPQPEPAAPADDLAAPEPVGEEVKNNEVPPLEERTF